MELGMQVQILYEAIYAKRFELICSLPGMSK